MPQQLQAKRVPLAGRRALLAAFQPGHRVCRKPSNRGAMQPAGMPCESVAVACMVAALASNYYNHLSARMFTAAQMKGHERRCSCPYLQAYIAVECVPKGAVACKPDATGNVGPGNVGADNFGRGSVGNNNIGVWKLYGIAAS